jgi:hypothetical protein
MADERSSRSLTASEYGISCENFEAETRRLDLERCEREFGKGRDFAQ